MQNNVIQAFPRHSQDAVAAARASKLLRHGKLAAILRQSAATEGDALFPLLASMLLAHLDGREYSDMCIRACLDEMHLLLALELVRDGVVEVE